MLSFPSQNIDLFTLSSTHHQLLREEMLPHMPKLYRYALKLTTDTGTACDLVQETYLKACRYLGHFTPGTNAKAWLYRILKNTFINEYRRTKRAPVRTGLDDMLALGKIPTASLATPHAANLWSEHSLGDEVSHAMQALPADYRMAIILCDVEGFSYDEIAEIMAIPVGTVRSRLHRGRNQLRSKLLRYAAVNGYLAAGCTSSTPLAA